MYNHFSIYAYGLVEANYYNVWPINQTDYYSIKGIRSNKICFILFTCIIRIYIKFTIYHYTKNLFDNKSNIQKDRPII